MTAQPVLGTRTGATCSMLACCWRRTQEYCLPPRRQRQRRVHDPKNASSLLACCWRRTQDYYLRFFESAVSAVSKQ
jgi:hypothetical protein